MKVNGKQSALLGAALLLLSLTAPLSARAQSRDWVTPAIPGFGAVMPQPQARYRPSGHDVIKVVFDVSSASRKNDQVNPALERVAATINAYVVAGVPLDHLKMVAIVSGDATPLVLDDAHYQKLSGPANPNLPLIAALKSAGVDVLVSGQALARQHLENDWVADSVALALSLPTTLITLEQQGYTAFAL